MNRGDVDSFLRDGCGRCDRYRTPDCKVHRWGGALVALRALVLEVGLVEAMKWGSPCYTLDGKNVVMLVARADYCALSFFAGAALDDPTGALESPGPNSRFVRYLAFRSEGEVMARRRLAAGFVAQAVALQRAGRGVDAPPADDPVPDELASRLASDPALRRAFEALTPGRRRSHVLYVSGAKKTETRERRVDRCAPKIRAGKGFQER